MFIQVTPKRMKTIAVSATLSVDGVKFEERFASVARFVSFMRRQTKYVFHNAVDYINNEIVHAYDIHSYINKYSTK